MKINKTWEKTVLVEKEDYNLWERTWEAKKIQYQALTLDHGKNVFFEKSAPYEDLKHSFDQIVRKSLIVSSRLAPTSSFYKLSSIGVGGGRGVSRLSAVLNNRSFYSWVLYCQAFDLAWGWSWLCYDRDQYLVSMIEK